MRSGLEGDQAAPPQCGDEGRHPYGRGGGAKVGDRMEIMIDANQAQSPGDWQPGVLWSFQRAVETARELQRLRCVWLEEPLPRYSFDRLAELNRLVEIPIAGGENSRWLHEYLWMLQQGVYDIVQPET